MTTLLLMLLAFLAGWIAPYVINMAYHRYRDRSDLPDP